MRICTNCFKPFPTALISSLVTYSKLSRSWTKRCGSVGIYVKSAIICTLPRRHAWLHITLWLFHKHHKVCNDYRYQQLGSLPCIGSPGGVGSISCSPVFDYCHT